MKTGMTAEKRTPDKKTPAERINALPLWSGPVEPQPLTGGLSNESFTVEDRGEKYVVRFGHDFPFHHVLREREIMVARAAYEAGFTPQLVHAEPGVMVSRFIEGRTYGPGDVKANIGRIVATVRRFHTEMPRHVSGPGFMFWVFHVLRDYARTLKEAGAAPPRLAELLSAAEELEAAQTPLPIVFGHNDLLPANFLDDGERLWLIDFEYAGFATAMFDLAGIAANAGFSDEESAALLTDYFGTSPSPEILKCHAAMQCAALLREALWGMVSAIYLAAPGADYEAYVDDNLRAFDAAFETFRHRFGKA